MYRRKLITNDGFIDHYQKVHREYEDTFPKIIIKFEKSLKNKK